MEFIKLGGVYEKHAINYDPKGFILKILYYNKDNSAWILYESFIFNIYLI